MLRRHLGALLLLQLMVLSGCFPAGTRDNPFAGGSSRTGNVEVQVENRHWATVNVFMLRAGHRVRLGTLDTSQSQVFEMPRQLLDGSGDARFVVDPIGSTRSYVSDPVPSFGPGSRILFRVENNLRLSTVSVF